MLFHLSGAQSEAVNGAEAEKVERVVVEQQSLALQIADAGSGGCRRCLVLVVDFAEQFQCDELKVAGVQRMAHIALNNHAATDQTVHDRHHVKRNE